MIPSQEYLLIPLTQGQFAKVSAHRFEEINRHRWYAWWNSLGKTFYAVRRVYVSGKLKSVYMHRQLLGLEFGDQRQGDHINHVTLDNTDDNLRIATRSQNLHNLRKHRRNKSGYKGVCWDRRAGMWLAQICVNGIRKNLGRRESAAAAYHELWLPAAIKYHGEFICLG